MNSLVNFAFDTVAWLSSWLTIVFEVIARGNSDALAAIITGCCLLVILACYSLAAENASFMGVLSRTLAPMGILLVLGSLTCRLGTEVTNIAARKLHRSEGHAWKTNLNGSLAAALESSHWWLVSSEAGIGASKFHLRDSAMRKTATISKVKGDGGGGYLLKNGTLWISHRPGSTTEDQGLVYKIVREKKWAGTTRGMLAWGFAAGALLVFLRRIRPAASRAMISSVRDPLLAVPLVVFVVCFGWHQTRFIEQDGRMQLVTSRDDDGYMLDRLSEAARLKTMDPLKLGNTAYGAIGFYPFALPSFIAGQMDIRPSIPALNISTRGQKLLISAAMLVAVWFLAARHFGRWPALGAVMLTATHEGFLSYSSYPFYPDVLMALLATLSLAFTLDLTRAWNGRAFILATAFAAMSVSIKFLTFLLFPLIAIVALLSLRRHTKGMPASAALSLTGTTIAAAAFLCVATFFLCNPYLEYNIGWLVPNYKMCGSYYSAESPNVVTDRPATWADWLMICYASKAQVTDLCLAGLSLLLAAFCPVGTRFKSVVLLIFAFCLQAYLLRSITLRSAIDSRLLLPGLPPLYVVAAASIVGAAAYAGRWWKTSQSTDGGAAISPVKARLPGALTCLFAAIIMLPRLQHGVAFLRDFGRFPGQSAVCDWLREIDLPKDARIVTSLQSYFPPHYRRLIDGAWQPEAIVPLLYDNDDAAPVFIEEESYQRELFSRPSPRPASMTGVQAKLFDSGSRFYQDLRGGRLIPFAPMARGEEVVATNFAPGPGMIARFRAYANVYHGSFDLTSCARPVPDGGGAGCEVKWNEPVFLGLVHLITSQPQEAGSLKVAVEDGAGRREICEFQCPEHPWGKPVNFYLRLQPARAIRGLRVIARDGSEADQKLVNSLRAYAPAPVTMNPTSYHFDLATNAENGSDSDVLMSHRFGSEGGVEIAPGTSREWTLQAKRSAVLEAIWLTIADVPSDSPVARCTFTLANGREVEVAGTAHILTGSKNVAVQFLLADASPVTKALIRVVNAAPTSGGQSKPLILRQVYAVAHDANGELD